MKLKFFLSLCLFFILCFCFNFKIEATEIEDNFNEKIENKIVCKASIDGNFDDKSILVVLDEKSSQFSGVSTEVLNMLYENGVDNFQNLIEYSSQFLNSYGLFAYLVN